MHGRCLLGAGIVGFASLWILNRDLGVCRLFPRVYVWVYGRFLQTVFAKSFPARRHTSEILPLNRRPVNCANMTERLMNILKTLKICTRGERGFSACLWKLDGRVGRERDSFKVSVCLFVCFGGERIVCFLYEGCLLIYVYMPARVPCSFSSADLS